MASKYNINLLKAELLPEMVLLTLQRVVALWLVSLVVMLVWAFLTDLQNQHLNKVNNKLKFEKINQTKMVALLEQRVTNRKVDPQLDDRLAQLNLLLQHKEILHAKLTDKKQTFVSGFAMAMSELAEFHHNDIRLQKIKISNDDMSFKGLAKNPATVPAWLSGFKYSTLLSGKSFVHFKLMKNDQNLTGFIVSSSAIEKGLE